MGRAPTGDCFRELQRTRHNKVSKEDATEYVLSCMSQSIRAAVLQRRGLTLDCQLREDSDIFAERRVLEQCDVCINLLVNLTCSETAAALRICARQRSQDDISRKRKREAYGFEESVLKLQRPGRDCGCVLDVDTESEDQEKIYAVIQSRVEKLVLSKDFTRGFLPPAR